MFVNALCLSNKSECQGCVEAAASLIGHNFHLCKQEVGQVVSMISVLVVKR